MIQCNSTCWDQDWQSRHMLCPIGLSYARVPFSAEFHVLQLYCTVEIDLYDQHELRFADPFMTKTCSLNTRKLYYK